MYIKDIEKELVIKPLQIVIGNIERKLTMPIMSNVLVQYENSVLSFTSSDLEIQITSFLKMIIEDNHNFEFTVGGKKLHEILRILPEQSKVNLNVLENKILLSSKKSKFTLQTMPAGDFPKISEIIDEPTRNISVSQNEFKNLLLSVQYSMAQQDVRYFLNGVLLIIDNYEIKAVATDGHRLAYNSIKLEENLNSEKIEIIIPRKAILELTKILNDNDDPVNIEFNNQKIKVQFSNILFISKLIEGKFPDYQRVIPKYVNHLELDRMLILQSLQRAAILCNEKIRGVRFVLTEKNLCIICSNSDQEEAQEEIETTYHGEALDIGFNVNYLLEGLLNIASEIITLSFGDPNSSILISNPNSINFQYVVMPMRI